MLHHVIGWVDALAETARVLRPGGAVIGYDLTDTQIARWIHKADGSPHRIIAADELADGLAVAGFIEISVRQSFAGHLMRFHAHKPGGHRPGNQDQGLSDEQPGREPRPLPPAGPPLDHSPVPIR